MSVETTIREMILIPNTVIAEHGIMPAELNAVARRLHYCELGSPAVPALEDYAPVRFPNPGVAERVQRYKTTVPSEIIAMITDIRIDVAGNLVGKVKISPDHPKSVTVQKAYNKPKCGIKIQPRIGREYWGINNSEAKVFGFDVGFK